MIDKLPALFQWIESNLDKPLSPEILAQQMECSQRHLCNLFRKKIGVNPAKYIRLRRLTLASVMLRETGCSVTEISTIYGFEHVQSFCRLFKRYSGVSPLEYRWAPCWDMRLFLPSAAVKHIECDFHFFEMNDLSLFFYKTNTLNIKSGQGVFIDVDNGEISSLSSIFNHYVKFVRDNALSDEFYLLGEVKPKKINDTEICVFMGEISNTALNDRASLKIPSCTYVCFSFKPDKLISLLSAHAWARGHGLHQIGCFLKRGPTFTRFRKTGNADIYETNYYIPVIV